MTHSDNDSDSSFTHVTLPTVDKRVLRLGLAANYGLSEADVRYAAERGVNYWVWTPRFKKVTPVLRDLLSADRDRHVVAYLAWGYTGGMVRRAVEKTLGTLGTDYVDVVQLAWLGKMSAFSEGIQEALVRLKEQGKIRAAGTSIHDRKRAGELAKDSILDLLMIRYNAKHPGAEQDIFPHLHRRNPAMVAYTATSWRQLLKPIKNIEMPPWPGAPETEGLPPLTAALCYRWCLTSPRIHVTLTGPADRDQLDQNLAALDQGPLSDEELAWISAYGEKVKAAKKWDYV